MPPRRKRSPVDVRVIVEGAADAEIISKVLQRMALGGEFNVTITSIIPTTHAHIARRAAEGADVVLIATDADKPGRKLASEFQEELEDLVGHVERVKLPLGHDVEHVNLDIVERELRNALIRAGLKGLIKLKRLREELQDLKERLEELEELEEQVEDKQRRIEELKEELERSEEKREELEEERERLEREVERLQGRVRELRERLKERERRLVPVSLEEVCREVGLSPEEVDPGVVEELGEALGVEVVVGDRRIAAPSRESALEVLKVYRSVVELSEGGLEVGEGEEEPAERDVEPGGGDAEEDVRGEDEEA
ncbi:MAG: toprim domain-containing protein [Euryarchaeota archaeon]